MTDTALNISNSDRAVVSFKVTYQFHGIPSIFMKVRTNRQENQSPKHFSNNVHKKVLNIWGNVRFATKSVQTFSFCI